jgi:hypothetical protein
LWQADPHERKAGVLMRRTLFVRVSLGVTMLLACATQPVRADGVDYLLRDQLKRQEVDVVLSGKVTQMRDVLSDPPVQHVTLLVERVWKGKVGRRFEVYRPPVCCRTTIRDCSV